MDRCKVAALGLWHLGCVYSACLADLGNPVVGWDSDKQRIEQLSQGIPPLFEPGLEELLGKSMAKQTLLFTGDLREAVTGASYVLFTFDTPVDDNDDVDLSEIFNVAKECAKYLQDDAVIVMSSQVPVGTCEQVKSVIQAENPSLKFDVACSPENLRLGQALQCFMEPERIVVGANDAATLDRLDSLFSGIEAPLLRMDLRTAEMTKHALNAFLATSVSFANEIGNICERVGADALRVAEALQSEGRIGRKIPLKPGLGFAGGTLARDMKVLRGLGDSLGYETPLIKGALAVNERQNKSIATKLEGILGSLSKRTVGVLGLTYKPGTSTLRRSAAIEIIGDLTRKGAKVKSFDPKASLDEIQGQKNFTFCPDPYAVAESSDALIFVTQWPEFRELDFDLMKSKMKTPAVVIDTQNMLDSEQLIQKGFAYFGTGRGMKEQRTTTL